MNNQSGLKKLLRLIITIAVVVLAVKWCSGRFGSVVPLPGGTEKENSDESGGWFRPKQQSDDPIVNEDLIDDVEELERELGIGKNKGSATSNRTPSTTTTTTPSASAAPLTFKGIPMTGTLSAFGSELAKAGFRNAGSGVYTGDFAGYSGCKVTPSGNPVREVRVDFPVISDWDALEKAYDDLQASLTRKYGIDPVTSTGNNIATYNLPGGTITLDADVKDRTTWHVILTYANAFPTSSTGGLGRNPIDDL